MKNSQLYKGSLNTIIMKLLEEQGRMYGYEITQKVKEITKGELNITEGALYPALHKLEAEGLLDVEVEKVDNRLRKYYKLTEKGTTETVNRLAELEKMMADKDAAMKKLKETLTKSLKAFEGKGLTVTEKDGKVYVSMENKLLFESGSWTVGSEGKKAVDLVGKVLGDNPDISVLIEGHTDNDKITGTIGGGVENNWDLFNSSRSW
jgi:DNA-binding PadR family transcriptional regulator